MRLANELDALSAGERSEFVMLHIAALSGMWQLLCVASSVAASSQGHYIWMSSSVAVSSS